MTSRELEEIKKRIRLAFLKNPGPWERLEVALDKTEGESLWFELHEYLGVYRGTISFRYPEPVVVLRTTTGDREGCIREFERWLDKWELPPKSALERVAEGVL